MTDRDAAVALEVARTADACTIAVRAAAYAVLDELIQASAHREELVAMWARLLVTVVPEDLAAELIDQLWRHDDSHWLIAVEHFLDYAQQRDIASLDRFAAEVTSWPWPVQAEFARVVLGTIARALPDGIVPSHYLVARGMIIEAAELLDCPELVDPLAGLVSLGWRADGAPATRLAYDVLGHIERELPGTNLRAVKVLALVSGSCGGPVEPHDGIGLLGDALRATAMAARAVRLAETGDLHQIETELTAPADNVPVLLALALAVASGIRGKENGG
ncbi:hypothetical protein [Amycolatopsis sp. GM8]|uniref:hypothetical protein n=1 Tax=Amycolatopsis sp. GM8 TaxID=2896530 RepID=UPI001F26ACD2|nr:hypothetical protein [Amycolatopsis sp. GM8]